MSQYYYQPFFSRIVVKMEDVKERYVGGIYIPDKMSHAGYYVGEITHLGPESGYRIEDGVMRNVMDLKIGMKVLFKREHIIRVPMPDGTELCSITDDHSILGILHEATSEKQTFPSADGKVFSHIDDAPVYTPDVEGVRLKQSKQELVQEIKE